ncbi:hypothetical protein AAFF_G00136790 [Aldrovandia affinis]|uniref:Uncharacterized protein n=1 Tax=Aldrovandia affinis TaxID=143900 RepID=A0AAD7TBQ4_9TELE|nr:hypothetical protein AAFF_G00136790 [Aldrovandia affinis]
MEQLSLWTLPGTAGRTATEGTADGPAGGHRLMNASTPRGVRMCLINNDKGGNGTNHSANRPTSAQSNRDQLRSATCGWRRHSDRCTGEQGATGWSMTRVLPPTLRYPETFPHRGSDVRVTERRHAASIAAADSSTAALSWHDASRAGLQADWQSR